MENEFWIMRLVNKDGGPSEYLLRSLAVSEDEAWEKYLYKEIDKDIACMARKPHDPFPEYWKERNRLGLYGTKAVKVKLIESNANREKGGYEK